MDYVFLQQLFFAYVFDRVARHEANGILEADLPLGDAVPFRHEAPLHYQLDLEPKNDFEIVTCGENIQSDVDFSSWNKET